MPTKSRYIIKRMTFSCDVVRPVPSMNASHEKIATETPVASDVKCFPGNPSGRMKLESFGIDPLKAKIFFFEYDQDVQERDIIVFDGRRFIVRYIVQPGPATHHLEAYTESVSGG